MNRIGIALMAGVAATAILYSFASGQALPGNPNEWTTYGHDKGGMRFSPLTQITPANVGRLRVAWTYHMNPTPTAAGPARAGGGGGRGGPRLSGGGGEYGDPAVPQSTGQKPPPMRYAQSESTPLVINGVMYTTTPYSRVVALDPITGKEIWVYQIPNSGQASTRGLEYWPGDASHPPRIYFHSSYGSIIALDAKTGALVTGFGAGGMLAAGPGAGGSSPPLIVGNVIVSQRANPYKDGSDGDIRGFDVLTGRQVWRFNSIPASGEPHYGTWPGGPIVGRPHMWGLLTADVPRNIVYVTFSAPQPNRWGGDREGANLFSSSIVAVDARNGRYLWHFQLVHHDIWDADMQSPPMLFDVRRNGQTIPAVAAVNKMALLFILNRVTGEHIYKVEERPMPKSAAPEERTFPTQPIPVEIPPVARQSINANQLANVTPQHTAWCKKWIADNKIQLEGGPYIPAGYLHPTVQFPGTIGGSNWGGMSFNPQLGYLFINTFDLGQVQGIEPFTAPPSAQASTPNQQPNAGRGGGAGAAGGVGGGRGGNVDEDDEPGGGSAARHTLMEPFGRFKEASSNMMCNAPPWGRLIAVNVNTGKFAWEVTLGVTDDLPPALQKTGRPSLGGSINTASGLVFVGATDDKRFRAFDSRNGRELWVTKMPAVAASVPITYLGKDGKQYVAVTATGSSFMDMPVESDVITAFTLP
jgi:quinoprotein glucose dehydrogenase